MGIRWLIYKSKRAEAELNELAHDFLLIYPGPEVAFAEQMKGAVRLVPMDDLALIKESLKGVSPETMNFDPDKAGLRPEARARLQSNYLDKTHSGEMPTKEDIESILRLEPDQVKKEKLRKGMTELLNIVRMVNARDEHFAKALIDQNQHAVLVVGQNHVQGLAKIIEQHCRREALR